MFIYQKAQSFNIVENESFKELFNFDLISVETLNAMMKQDFSRLLSGIQKEIDKSLFVSLILDEWKFHKNSFIGITVFWRIDIEINSIVLTLSILSAFDRTETISKQISSQLKKFLFKNKIISSVTDCAAVMRKAIEISEISWTPCLSHILHNSAKHMLNSVSGFNDAMLHANEISTDYIFKQYLSAQFNKKQNLQMFNDTESLGSIPKTYPLLDGYSHNFRLFEIVVK